MKIVVVGAGPAGLAAACCAGESGASVILIDDNPSEGGQIWKGSAGRWKARLKSARVDTRMSHRIISGSGHELTVENASGAFTLPFSKLILATGARELFIPFPGWTLPGVTGAGGLQSLVKTGLPVAGKRIVIAGTGPLLLAVAAYLKKQHANVVLIAEQTTWSRLVAFGAALPWGKRFQAVRLWKASYTADSWVEAAEGSGKVERVTVRRGGRVESIDCDYLATGYGLVPNTELARLFSCDPSSLDEFQQSAVPDIYCAGEMTGIGGADLSLVEGAIAGYAAADKLDQARRLFATRETWIRFARQMSTAFALRPELQQLARPETLVCRCEDVSLVQLRPFHSWREAKLQTRCGMGPCQGRICGPAVQFLLGWQSDSVRPPIFPSRVSSLITEQPIQ